MKDKVFFDTNILFYAFSTQEMLKQQLSLNLLSQVMKKGTGWISVQVLNELYVNFLKKAPLLPAAEAQQLIYRISLSLNVISMTTTVIYEAFQIQNRYQIAFWDSLIVASALLAGCTTLFTEDIQHNQLFDTVKVVNPFVQ